MSKIATVRALNDSEPQLQVVAAVRDLQQIMSSMQSDLSNLPQSVAAVRDLQQIMSSMQTDMQTDMSNLLSNLPQSVTAVRDLQQLMSSIQTDMNNLPSAVASELSSLGALAESLDKALTAQRQTLDMLTKETTKEMEQRLAEIVKTQRKDTAQLRQAVSTLQTNVEAIQRASKLPKQIEDATATMKDAAADLTRSRTWLLTSAIVASAVLSATLAVGGMHLLNRAGMTGSSGPAQQSAPAAQNQGDVWERVNELARER